MPSQRAILIDLEKNKLKFDRPHTALDKSGHIVDKSTNTLETIVDDENLIVPTPCEYEAVSSPVEQVVEENHEDEVPSIFEFHDAQEQPEMVPLNVVSSEEEKIEENSQIVETPQTSKRRGRKFNTRA